MESPLRVHITVDTECSIGGVFATTDPDVRPVGPERRIWGKAAGGEWGIRRMMGMLEDHGLVADFFLEPFASYRFGERAIARVASEVLARGHGLELHAHPNMRAFKSLGGAALTRAKKNPCPGKLWQYDGREQAELIGEAADLLTRWTGRRPVAFRAGGYSADERTLEAVRTAGLEIDSSAIDPRAVPLCRIPAAEAPNRPRVQCGVVELPVTSFVHRRVGRFESVKFLDLCGVTGGQLRSVLEALHAEGTTDAVIVLHSFSFLRAADVQYRKVRPNRLVMGRFRELLGFLAGDPARFEVGTMRDLVQRRKRTPLRIGGPGRQPYPGLPSSLARDAVQALTVARDWMVSK